MDHALERIIVVPRNGYANRLQAWASSAILAAQLDVPLAVMWEPEAVAAAQPGDLFSASLIRRTFMPRTELDNYLGQPHEGLDRYLWVDPSRRLIVLAGHDKGEQVFMEALPAAMGDASAPSTLLVIAGGKFTLFPDEDFVQQRRIFYSRMAWSEAIDSGYAQARAEHSSYLGAHIRGTDRSLEAPTRKTLNRGLEQLALQSSERSLFIAADSASAGANWCERSKAMGFQPWVRSNLQHDRSMAAAGVDALIDWRLLAAAEAIVFTQASSFGEEAAVATGHFGNCIPLAAGPGIQRLRAARDTGHSAVTYPARRFRRD